MRECDVLTAFEGVGAVNFGLSLRFAFLAADNRRHPAGERIRLALRLREPRAELGQRIAVSISGVHGFRTAIGLGGVVVGDANRVVDAPEQPDGVRAKISSKIGERCSAHGERLYWREPCAHAHLQRRYRTARAGRKVGFLDAFLDAFLEAWWRVEIESGFLAGRPTAPERCASDPVR